MQIKRQTDRGTKLIIENVSKTTFIFYLEDGNCGPEQGIEILPVTDPSLRVHKLAPEQIHPQNTETFRRFNI